MSSKLITRYTVHQTNDWLGQLMALGGGSHEGRGQCGEAGWGRGSITRVEWSWKNIYPCADLKV